MVIDHTNPESVTRCIRRVTATLRALADIGTTTLQLVASDDGEIHYATGEPVPRTDGAVVSNAVTLAGCTDHSAAAAAMVGDIVSQLSTRSAGEER